MKMELKALPLLVDLIIMTSHLMSVLAAVFIRDYKIRLLVFAVSILAFFVFGGVGTVLGESKTPVRRTCDCDSADWRLDDYGYYFWL